MDPSSMNNQTKPFKYFVYEEIPEFCPPYLSSSARNMSLLIPKFGRLIHISYKIDKRELIFSKKVSQSTIKMQAVFDLPLEKIIIIRLTGLQCSIVQSVPSGIYNLHFTLLVD